MKKGDKIPFESLSKENQEKFKHLGLTEVEFVKEFDPGIGEFHFPIAEKFRHLHHYCSVGVLVNKI